MKGNRTIVTDDLYEYIIDNYVTETELMNKLHYEYIKHKIPQISITPEQGKFLYILVKMINSKKILEVGTLIGYSSLWLYQALPSDGELITIEVSKKHYDIALRFFKENNLDNKINLWLGKALEFEKQLLQEAPFDVMFIDAGKEEYPEYIKLALKLVRKGGIIAFDNTLSKGRVVDSKETKKGVWGVRKLNRIMGNSPNLESILVPIADGISIGIVK